MKTVKDKAYKEALDEFRQKHFKELTTNLEVLTSIRDTKETLDKDRITASKEINMMLAARAQDKRPVASKTPITQSTEDLSKKEGAELEELLGNA